MYKTYKETRKQMRELEADGYDIDVQKNISFNGEEIKRRLKEELEKSSDMLFNAFIILQIRDAILEVKELIAQFHNIDLNILVENMNSLQDLIELLDEIGLNDNSWTVSLSEAIEIGINDFKNKFNGLTNQMALIGVTTGINMVNDVVQNVSIGGEIQDISRAFEFKDNMEDGNFEITLVIYKDPTLLRIQKNIVKVLTNAEDKNGIKLFDAGQVVNITTQLKEAYNQKKDRDIEFNDFTFKIHFEIEGFNQTLSENIYNIVT